MHRSLESADPPATRFAQAAALTLLLVWAVLQQAHAQAQAQAPAREPVAAASAFEILAAELAAMQRAQRQAAAPMRVILEAGKPRRQGNEAEPPAPAAAVAPTLFALPSPPQRATAAVNAPLGRADAGTATSLKLNGDVLQGMTAGSAVAAIDAASLVTAVSSRPGAAPELFELHAALPEKPRLMSKVDPDIPPRLLLDLGSVAEVLADLTIRADGSVAAVLLLPPVPRQIARHVVAALEQWRFDPLPAERVHRVQLVFNTER